ncbi:MAG: amidohydrolase family protein [Eubacteriales bacterium]|nr:amidohydrolase family protein [Clostridiales bacterium]MDY5836740.1 amidohydrolase family protein [Eubacteriales bacterium]
MMLLKNCKFVKELMTEYAEDQGDVLVEKGKITQIGQIDEKAFPIDELYDLKGAYLLPGLMEFHTHLNWTEQNYLTMIVENPVEAAFHGYAYVKEYVRQGYTFIRDCGSSYGCINEVRNAIQAGYLQGPDISSSGEILTPTEIGNISFEKMYVEADGPEDVARAVRKLFQKGSDFIKYMITGAFYNDGGVPGVTIVTPEELEMAVRLAKMRGSYVSTHAHGTEAIKLAIRSGVRTIEHGSLVDDEGIKMLLDTDESFIIPTIAVDKVPYDHPEQIPAHMWDKVDSLTKKSHECIRKAYDAGLKLGWGSDLDMYNFTSTPGYEFIARKEMLDFSNIDMLLQATKNSAEIAGLDGEIGSIGLGKRANLIVVRDNPVQDIYVMAEYPLHVFVDGKELARSGELLF